MPARPRAQDLTILPQPDDASCGPTCLHAIYRYFGDELPLARLIEEVTMLPGGGTLAVNLANHALRRGYRARIYTYNLALFDPSWFEGAPSDFSERLREQARRKRDPRLAGATEAYLEFLELGGEVEMEDLGPSLLQRWLEGDQPVLTGLSSTFLYRSPRERGETELVEDDLGGEPTGHFVVLSGWNGDRGEVRVADPLAEHPRHGSHVYWVPVDRVVNAILLGVLTYDANLLLLEPPKRPT